MIKTTLYNQAPQKPTFLYAEGKEILPEFEAEEVAEALSEKLTIDADKLSEEKPEEIVREVERLTADLIDDKVRSAIRKENPGLNDEEIERRVNDTVARLQRDIDRAKAIFYKNLEEDILDRLETLNETIPEDVEKRLDDLKEAVDKQIALKEATPEIKEAHPMAESWLESVPIIGPIGDSIPILSYIFAPGKFREYVNFRNTMEDRFGEFTDRLNEKYMNMEWREENLTGKEKDRYEDLADEMTANMQFYVKAQLEFIFIESKKEENPEKLKRRLEHLRDNMVNRYERYSRGDGIIDLADMEYMKKQAKRYLNLIQMINSGKSIEEIAKKAEYKDFFRREQWIQTTEMLSDQLIQDAINNGSEEAFVNAVMDLIQDPREKNYFLDALKNKDSSEDRMEFAAGVFKAEMVGRANAGVRETLAAVKQFNEAANQGRVDILQFGFYRTLSRKTSIHPLIYREREFLLGGIHLPENIDDKQVVEFMQGNRESRDAWLSDPTRREALFISIKNVTNRLEGKGDLSKAAKGEARALRQRIGGLPKKTSQLTSWKGRPDKRPTAHDKLARSLALITLANEAKWVIENLSQAYDYKAAGLNLKKELEETDAERNPPKSNVIFRNVNKLYSTRFISRAARGGFNGRDLMLNVGKVWAGATIFLNLMNARRAGKTWGEKFEAAVSNPYIYAAAGAMWGINKYQENPEVKNYLFEDVGGQVRIKEHLALNSLARKTGREKVVNFINPENHELNLLENIMKNKKGFKAIQDAMKEAKKAYPPHPKLKKEMLKKALEKRGVLTGEGKGDEALLNALYSVPDFGNNRMRYLFYEKMITSDDLSISELRDHCKTWK